jgi:hypothetical protein
MTDNIQEIKNFIPSKKRKLHKLQIIIRSLTYQKVLTINWIHIGQVLILFSFLLFRKNLLIYYSHITPKENHIMQKISKRAKSNL